MTTMTKEDWIILRLARQLCRTPTHKYHRDLWLSIDYLVKKYGLVAVNDAADKLDRDER